MVTTPTATLILHAPKLSMNSLPPIGDGPPEQSRWIPEANGDSIGTDCIKTVVVSRSERVILGQIGSTRTSGNPLRNIVR